MRTRSALPWKLSPIRARRSNSFLALPLLLAALCPLGLGAAPQEDRRAELREQQGQLRQRIDALRADLTKSEESRSQAADQLKATESAISDAERRLHRLSEDRQAVERQVGELDTQSRHLGRQADAQQAQLSRLLYRQYTRGEADALQQLLAGRDPNQAAFDDHLLRLLGRAKADLITELRGKRQQQTQLAAAALEKTAELAAIEQRQREARAALVEQKKQRQAVLARVADKISAQRREIGSLQKDEKRLAKLVEGLMRIVTKPARAKSAAVASAGATASLRNEATPDPGQATGAFAALKGRLRLPVKGTVINRFGTPRPEGGTRWKGLFIRAAAGAEVKAIAAGQVVYADWLRGFGNLLVLDHGDGFLSVYGNNQSLLRETGDNIRTGEALAAVGNSGGNPESGLYFELRHQGQAFDPLRWVALR